ncbi:MAG: hypothetical protein K6E76_04665 [Patescibacteria group bacterium]|nr:hypothetical protein [Patescibacteria group bacterium]
MKGLIIDGTFATASVNDQSVAADGSLTKVQTLAAGDSTEIQIIAAADRTAKLTGIEYSVTDG